MPFPMSTFTTMHKYGARSDLLSSRGRFGLPIGSSSRQNSWLLVKWLFAQEHKFQVMLEFDIAQPLPYDNKSLGHNSSSKHQTKASLDKLSILVVP